MMESGVKYQVITPEKIQEAINLFNDQYVTHEPMCKAIQAPKRNTANDQTNHQILEQGLSWCAVDEKSGKMVGMTINSCISLADLPDVPPTFDEYVEHGFSSEWSSMQVLFDMALDKKSIFIANQESRMLELCYGCVHSEYRKKNICIEIITRSLEHAVTLGFTLAETICTGVYSQRLFEKLGFKRVKEIFYASYVDGKTNTLIFKNVEEPHKSSISYINTNIQAALANASRHVLLRSKY